MGKIKVLSFLFTLVSALGNLGLGYGLVVKSITWGKLPGWSLITLGILFIGLGVLGGVGSVLGLFGDRGGE